MRFDRVERVATARACHEYFDKYTGNSSMKNQIWYRDRVWVEETQRHACISVEILSSAIFFFD